MVKNRLLELFTAREGVDLLPHLQEIHLERGSILHDAEGVIDRVYFPGSALVSLVVPLQDGSSVEAGLIGSDGVVGASTAINGQRAAARAIVQIQGDALFAEIEAVRELSLNNRALHNVLASHEQVILAQSNHSAACNASHTLHERFAKWLLIARDRTQSDSLFLTQDFIADMLGVRRTSVTIEAHNFMQAGLIRYRRGHIQILMPAALKEASCECYDAVSRWFDRLYGPRENW